MAATRLTLATLATLALASLTAAAPVEPRQQTCYSGVYMIVARGSTEDPGEGKPGEVADLVTGALPGSASVAVDYPASIVDPPYPESVVDGITDTINKVHSYVDACGSASKIALVGYSQGGNVMTDALAGGVDKPDPLDRSYTQYITAVTVFGDPSFTHGQSFDVGTATTDGIFARSSDGDSLALLNTYASVIQSYCNAGDTFCASGTDEDVHSAEVDDFKQQAANFIVAQNS